jgi:quercetin dioxygenase-like cupin family protein
MTAALANSSILARAHVRRARDFVVRPKVDPNDLHRAAHPSVVDYRLQEITGDTARAMATMPGFCADKPAFSSPWHYHDCEIQIGLVLDGSVELGFSKDTYSRVKRGDVSLIPGHFMHDVRGASADYQVVEFTFPGSFATIENEVPPPGTPSAARLWGTGAAMRAACKRGLITYVYPVEAPYSDRYRIELERQSRVDAFEPGSLEHEDRFQFLYVIQGTRTIAIEGEQMELGAGDVLVIPRGAQCDDIASSEEHEALRIRMPK